MRKFLMSYAAAMLVAALAAVPAWAHHGWGNYDAANTLTLTGKVLESAYQNPHGEMKLQVPGKVWHVILAPPSRMQNRNLPPENMKPGATVTVVGYAHKSEAAELRAERIIIAGVTTELR